MRTVHLRDGRSTKTWCGISTRGKVVYGKLWFFDLWHKMKLRGESLRRCKKCMYSYQKFKRWEMRRK